MADISLTLPLNVAQDVYDALYVRMEQLDSFDPTPQRERESASLMAAIDALSAAGVGPAPASDD